jgi:hypothetical protein
MRLKRVYTAEELVDLVKLHVVEQEYYANVNSEKGD